MDRIFEISKLLAAATRLLVVMSLIVASSGAGHAEHLLSGHAKTDAVFEHSPNTTAEKPTDPFAVASGACKAAQSHSDGKQSSDTCCGGICISVALRHSNEEAPHSASGQSFMHHAELETSLTSITLKRPPRLFT